MPLIRFNTSQAYQRFLKDIIDECQDMKTLFPDAFDGISINVRRVVAAALMASYAAEPSRVAALIDHSLLPDSGYRDKSPEKNPYQKTVHVTLAMNDYIMAGTARLNIEVLGPLEDEEIAANPDISHRYRLTERQYMHLSLLYFAGLSVNSKKMMINASEILHPFLSKGMRHPKVYEMPTRSVEVRKLQRII